MKIKSVALTLTLLLFANTVWAQQANSSTMAKNLKPPLSSAKFISKSVLEQVGIKYFHVDFLQTSLDEFAEDNLDDAVMSCFAQLIEANPELKPLLALKEGALYFNGMPRDYFMTQCGERFFVVKLNVVEIPVMPPMDKTGSKSNSISAQIAQLFGIKNAIAGEDKNFPGITSGGGNKGGSGFKVMIVVSSDMLTGKIIPKAEANNPFGNIGPGNPWGTNNTNTNTSGTNTNTNTNTNTGNDSGSGNTGPGGE